MSIRKVTLLSCSCQIVGEVIYLFYKHFLLVKPELKLSRTKTNKPKTYKKYILLVYCFLKINQPMHTPSRNVISNALLGQLYALHGNCYFLPFGCRLLRSPFVLFLDYRGASVFVAQIIMRK